MAKDRDHGGYADPPSTFGGRDPEPPIPGAKFGRLRDEFDRVAAKAEARAESRASEAKANPFGPDAPLLPGLAILTRKAAERCEAEAKNYRDVVGSQAPTAPVSFMRTVGMILSVVADSMDDLAETAE